MRKGSLGRLLGKAGWALLTFTVLAGLYLTLVIAQPQPENSEKSGEERPPLLSASPAQTISSENEIQELIRSFPGPVMSFMSGSGMTFVSGTSADLAWQGQFCRQVTLYWQTREGEPLILQSIYPAEALEIMGRGDYSFSGSAGPTLFGMPSVRMENRNTVRVHVQAEGEGLYVLTVPKTLEGALSDLSRSIQLFVTAG